MGIYKRSRLVQFSQGAEGSLKIRGGDGDWETPMRVPDSLTDLGISIMADTCRTILYKQVEDSEVVDLAQLLLFVEVDREGRIDPDVERQIRIG